MRKSSRWICGQDRVGKEYINVNAWMQIARPIFPSPRLLYFGIAEMTRTLAIFPHMRHVVTLHSDHIRIEHHLPEPFVACPFFFHGNVGEYGYINTLFGLPPARIEADVSGRHGIYDIYFTNPPTPLDERLELGGDVFVGFAGEFRQLLSGATSIEEGTALQLSRSAVLDLQRTHGLTLAEARIAARLASGRNIAAMANDLSVSVGTIRTHLKAAYAKTGVRRQSELVRLVLMGPQKSL